MTKLKVGSFFTNSGKQFDAIDPDLDDIDIHDIAHALSNICRYNGHSTIFYSVADHSIRVANLCSQENKAHALLHDASEAYIADIIRPLKIRDEFEFYRNIEENLMNKIFEKFELSTEVDKEVKLADTLVLATELRDLTNVPEEYLQEGLPKPLDEFIEPLSIKEAELTFLELAWELRLWG